MAQWSPDYSKIYSCLLAFRGNIFPNEVYSAAGMFKQNKTVQFCDWVPNSFKILLNDAPPTVIPGCGIGKTQRNCCMFSNTRGIT